jgi:hypothetical protein
MIAHILPENTFGVTDIILIVGFMAILVDRILDANGWSRSSKVLRVENTDLVRRNKELEETVARHEKEIAALSGQVELLRQRDQTAVLDALERHELNAERRADRTSSLLVEIRDVLSQSTKAKEAA